MRLNIFYESKEDLNKLIKVFSYFEKIYHNKYSIEYDYYTAANKPLDGIYYLNRRYNISRAKTSVFLSKKVYSTAFKLINLSDFFDSNLILNKNKLPVYKDLFFNEDINDFINFDVIELIYFVIYNSFDEKNNPLKQYLDKPVVNYYFEILKQIIDETVFQAFPKETLYKKKAQRFYICLSHDVDYITPGFREKLWDIILLLKYIHKNLKKTNKIRGCLNNLKIIKNTDLVRNIIAIEKGLGFKSTFFYYSKRDKNNTKDKVLSLLFDPEYHLSKLKEEFDLLINNNFEIGLHGGFSSYKDHILFKDEKLNLGKHANSRVVSNRFHCLNFSKTNSGRILANNGIRFDSSLGFVFKPGFYNGFAHPYYLNLENTKIFEIPLIVMDVTLFRYMSLNQDESFELTIKILNEVKKFNGIVSICWHYGFLNKNYYNGEFLELYQRVLQWIHDNNGLGIPLRDIEKYYA
tara:strand:+ start:242 stop:1630 length:1389 start_codon:yes stop_codon:yes gene_type:complete